MGNVKYIFQNLIQKKIKNKRDLVIPSRCKKNISSTFGFNKKEKNVNGPI